MKHEITFTQKLIFGLVLLIGAGFIYYNFALKYFRNQLNMFNTDVLEQELIVEQSKASQIDKMKRIIEEQEGKITGDLSVYNNQYLEIIEMGRIFNEDGYDVSISWDDPYLTDTIVRRDVNIKCSSESYANFRNILKKMSEMKYRCLIGDMTVADGLKKDSTGIVTSSKLNSSIKVTFFETIDGAESLAGLILPEDYDLSESEMAQRAHAYDDK